MSDWIEVCATRDVPRLEGRRVVVEGFHIGVFNTEEGFFAVGDVCPHQGGPLSDGDVAATTVSCPLHARKVDLRTGEVKNDDLCRALTFPVKTEEDRIFVDVEALSTQPSLKNDEDDEGESEAVA